MPSQPQHDDAIENQRVLTNGCQDDEKIPSTEANELQKIQTHVSNHDMHMQESDHGNEIDDEIYNRFPHHRKVIITFVLSLCSFLAPMSSTAILSAIPEVAATYNSTGSILNISNALYMLFMGISPCFWGPLSKVYGRRNICIVSAVLFFAFSVGTALAPNLPSFFVFRILTAIEGTSFLIVGASCLGDIYHPTERGTAVGWFMSGALIGPAFGPFIGGIIVTFQSWRVIFWLQSSIAGLATIMVILLLPETAHFTLSHQLEGLSTRKKAQKLWNWTSPVRVFNLLGRYPNLLIVAVASSSMVWNMYSLLTPIRYILNPRFHLTSPIQSGLFYTAPGCGYLLGTFFGGRWADRYVRKYMVKRGKRVPEDRLRSCLPFIGIVTPACMLIYGWSVEKAVGGVPLPVLAMFIQGVAQLFCFPSLNTFCLDVLQARSSEVVAGNYMVRYTFAALGSAVVLPAVEKIGIGWFSTISTAFLLVSTGLLWLMIIKGEQWRDSIEKKQKEKREETIRRINGESGVKTVEMVNEKKAEIPAMDKDVERGVIENTPGKEVTAEEKAES